MQQKIERIKKMIFNNTKVVENYFFMTMLQIINSGFGILLYPYLIRVLGANQYGFYIFAITVTNYFIAIIAYGFNFPAIKSISENKNNLKVKNDVLSIVFTSKFYLSLLTSLIFGTLLFTVDSMFLSWKIYLVCYLQVIAEILIPTWYFQGVQKMKVLTILQVSIRLLSVPFIFIFIKSPDDILIYAWISTGIMISIGIISNVYLKFNEKITLGFKKWNDLKSFYNAGFPFFLSSIVGTIRQESTNLIIGIFFGMREVAIFDLANKIVSIPRLLTASINNALFPQLIERIEPTLVKRVIRYEAYIGGIITILIAVFGYWAVLILGGSNMTDAYPITVIISITIFVWLVVGSFINFVFLPANKNYYVVKNQIIALITFLLFCIPALYLFKNILVIAMALAFSGIFELIYCWYIIKTKKLL